MGASPTTHDIRPTPIRAVLAFASVALGITIALAAPMHTRADGGPAIAAFLGAALLALTALAGPHRSRTAALAAAALAFGFGWATIRTAHAPPSFLGTSLRTLPSAPIITIEGVVTSPPEVGPAQRAGALARFAPPITVTRFRLESTAVILGQGAGADPASGTFHVRIDEPTDAVRIGDFVRLTGTALGVQPPTNPGEPDFRQRATQDRIAGTLLIPTAGLVEPAQTQPPPLQGARAAVLRARAGAQTHLRSWINNTADGDNRAQTLLAALLLGEREAGPHDLHGAFARVGLAHLLAISGLHLVAVAWGALFLLRLLGDKPRLETLIVLLAVIAYCFVVPVRTPIVRAAIMVVALLASELAGRRYHPIAVLALTALAVIIWKPTELASVGFQLSFGVVAALILCPPRIEQRLFPFDPPPDERTPAMALRIRLRRLVIAAVVAWAIATPLVAFRIGVVSPLAPIFTVILALPVTILLTGALGAALASAVLPPIGVVTGWLLSALASWIAGVALFADALPLAVVHVPEVSALWAVAATTVIGWWCVAGDRRNKPALVATLIMIAWTVVALLPPRLPGDQSLRIDSLDVGDGSCLLVRSGSDAILVDAGSGYAGAGLRQLPRALRSLGAPRIDTAFITHPNLDHYNALPDLARTIGLRKVLVCQAFLDDARDNPDGPSSALLDALNREGVRTGTIHEGDIVNLASLTGDVLSPPSPSPFADANDNSVVLRWSVPTAQGERSAIITGDIERDAMNRLLARHPDLRADIAEAPHHGSAVSGSGWFIQRIDPQVVLQSTGPGRLDDPRLDDARAGRTWFVTARDGAIWAAIMKDGSIESGSVR